MTIVLPAPRVLLSHDAVRGVRAGTNRAGVGMAGVPRRRRGRRRPRAGVLLPNVRSSRVRRIPEPAAFLPAPRQRERRRRVSLQTFAATRAALTYTVPPAAVGIRPARASIGSGHR